MRPAPLRHFSAGRRSSGCCGRPSTGAPPDPRPGAGIRAGLPLGRGPDGAGARSRTGLTPEPTASRPSQPLLRSGFSPDRSRRGLTPSSLRRFCSRSRGGGAAGRLERRGRPVPGPTLKHPRPAIVEAVEPPLGGPPDAPSPSRSFSCRPSPSHPLSLSLGQAGPRSAPFADPPPGLQASRGKRRPGRGALRHLRSLGEPGGEVRPQDRAQSRRPPGHRTFAKPDPSSSSVAARARRSPTGPATRPATPASRTATSSSSTSAGPPSRASSAASSAASPKTSSPISGRRSRWRR